MTIGSCQLRNRNPEDGDDTEGGKAQRNGELAEDIGRLCRLSAQGK
jgi:hypothetical protein